MGDITFNSRARKRVGRLLLALMRSDFDEASFLNSRKIVFYSNSLNRCVCGGRAYIERFIYGPDHTWIVRCPKCGRRNLDPGTFPMVRDQWNNAILTADSEMLTQKLTDIQEVGMIALIRVIMTKPKPCEGRKKKDEARPERSSHAV